MIAPEPGIDEPPVCTVVIMSWAWRGRDQRRVLVGVREGAEAGLGEPHAELCDLAEIVSGEAGLKNDRTRVHGHAAGPIMLEAFARRDGERLHPVRIARPPRHMHLGRTDRRGHAAMDVALEVADGLLARRVVAEGDVDVGVDEAGNGGRAAGVDDDVAALDVVGGRRAYGCDLVVLRDDGVARRQRHAPVAGNDAADVGNGHAHRKEASNGDLHSAMHARGAQEWATALST